jgi:hypothetical protein
MSVTQALQGTPTSNCRANVLSTATDGLPPIAPRAPLVANLRLDAGHFCQSRHAVRTAGLTVIHPIIMQFAVVIYFVAIIPSLPDQLSLPYIFTCPLAQRILLPGILDTRLHGQAPAHRLNPELIAMLCNDSVSHFTSLAERSDQRSIRGGFF